MKNPYFSTFILLIFVLVVCIVPGPASTGTDVAEEDSVLLKGSHFELDERGKRTFGQCYGFESYRDIRLIGALSEKLVDAGCTFAIKVTVAEDCKLTNREGTDFQIKLKEFKDVNVYMPIGMQCRVVDLLKAGTEVIIAYSPARGSVLVLNEVYYDFRYLCVNTLTSLTDSSKVHVIDLMCEQNGEIVICNYMKSHIAINQSFTSTWFVEFERVVDMINKLRNVPNEVKKKVNIVRENLKPVEPELIALNYVLEGEDVYMIGENESNVAEENMKLMRANCLWASHLLEMFRDQKLFSNVEPDAVR